nr:hypothetical protein BaRGS_005957 [Batillaria attramentaria]
MYHKGDLGSNPRLIAMTLVYSYDTCACVYETGSRAGDVPRFGSVSTTERAPEKCKDLAGLMYDEDKGRYVSSSYASMRGETANLGGLTQSVGGTRSNYALRLGSGAIKLQAFAGNDLRETWRASLRVRPMGQGNTMTVLSDDCDDADEYDKDKEQPSMVMTMTTDTVSTTLSLDLRFKNATGSDQCTVSRSDWYDIVVESVDSRITGTVNGEQCFDIPSPGAPLALTECALFVGGDPLDKDEKRNFDGYLETFEFVKNFDTCVDEQQQ